MNGWKTLTDMEVNEGEPEPFFHLPFTLLPYRDMPLLPWLWGEKG